MNNQISDERLREIAEALYVMMVGHCATGDMLWSADLCAEQPKPQPPADASPSLLEAATHVVNVWRTVASPSSMQAACDALRDAIAREEARAELLAAREHMGVVQSALDAAHLEQVEDELGGLRAEIRRLDGIIDDIEERAWKALGEPEGTYDSTNVQRLCAEVVRLRDMLARHKETP